MALALAVAATLGVASCTQTGPAPNAPPAAPVITATADELAKQAVELSGVRDQVKLGFSSMFQTIVTDPRAMPVIQEEVNVTVDQFALEAQKAWAQEFTLEELDAIVKFYQSPAGRSLVSKQPLIGEKLGPVGQRLGVDLGQRIEAKLRAQGLTP